MKTMTIEQALELESHFITASKALKCAYRNMKKIGGFEPTIKEVADAALDSDNAANQMRQWITDQTTD